MMGYVTTHHKTLNRNEGDSNGIGEHQSINRKAKVNETEAHVVILWWANQNYIHNKLKVVVVLPCQVMVDGKNLCLIDLNKKFQ